METVKTWRQYCAQKILKRMKGDRFGALFAHPVLEASDSIIPPAVKESYKTIIAKPMDYSTVRTNVDKGIYKSPEEFHEDMLLIYDNCMKFNPSVGVNKWIYEAAQSNKTKYLKLWEAAQGHLTKLVAKESCTVKETNENKDAETDSAACATNGSFEPEAPMVAPSQVETSPPKPQPFKFCFRLNIQQINDYKTRSALQRTQQEPSQPEVEALPPPEVIMDAMDTEPLAIEDAPVSAESAIEIPVDTSLSTTTILYDEAGYMPEVDMEETLTTVEVDMDIPSILSRREEGLLRVNWLSENECNQLFPHCSIIGLHEGQRQYNVSDVGIRCIYNELYLSDQATRHEHSKLEILDETITEDYTMKHHKMISFLLGQPPQYSGPTRCHLQEFADTDSTSITDEELSLPSQIDRDTSYESSSGNTAESDYNECEDMPNAKLQTLRVQLRTEATITIGPEAERVLLKNGFIRIRTKDSTVNCCPELTFNSEFAGFYKADESAFMYHKTAMRHIRLFLVNCGKVQVDLSRRCLPLAELILDHGAESGVYDLFLESRKRRSCNLAFFQLPNSGKPSYSRSMDLIWRLQTVVNALPTPFLVLHIVCRDSC